MYWWFLISMVADKIKDEEEINRQKSEEKLHLSDSMRGFDSMDKLDKPPKYYRDSMLDRPSRDGGKAFNFGPGYNNKSDSSGSICCVGIIIVIIIIAALYFLGFFK